MSSKNLLRRLERLELELTPNPDDQPVLKIVVARIGEPDRIIEVRGIKPNRRRRSPLRRNAGRDWRFPDNRMNALSRRLSKLEARVASRIEPLADGGAREELLKRIEAMRERFLPEDLVAESGPASDAARKRIEEWLSDWRRE